MLTQHNPRTFPDLVDPAVMASIQEKDQRIRDATPALLEAATTIRDIAYRNEMHYFRDPVFEKAISKLTTAIAKIAGEE